MLIYKYFILAVFLLFSVVAHSKTLDIFVVDSNNKLSLSRFLEDDKFSKQQLKKNNKIIFIDSNLDEAILKEYSVDNKEDIDKKELIQLLLNSIDKFLVNTKKNIGNMKINLHVRDSDRDVAAILKTLSEGYLRFYYDDYDDINIIFFGNSFIHNAYDHNFEKGFPSDGFFLLENSEFNQFDKGNYSKVKFHFFYDDEPKFSGKILRFYSKLIKLHFNSEINSYNDQFTFNIKPDVLGLTDTFYENELKILPEKSDSDCQAVDNFNTNYLDTDTKLEVTISNKCRINTVVTFKYNGKIINLPMDDSGSIKYIFNLQSGENKIEYQQINNEWTTIPVKNVSERNDFINSEEDRSTNSVTIHGKNPLRQNGTQVEILHKNSGAVKYAEVKNGEYSIPFQVSSGKNTFEVTQLDGQKQSFEIVYTTECQDELIYKKENAENTTVLEIEIKNKCRLDGSVVTFIYDKKKHLVAVNEGSAKTGILLHYPINEVFYENYDGNTEKVDEFTIKDYEDIIRLSISYNDNVAVIANIFEPNISITVPISGINYEDSSLFKDGHLHVKNQESSVGSRFILYEMPDVNEYLSPTLKREYKQIYLSRKKQQSKKGDLYFFADYFSRRGTYLDVLPLCDDKSLGGTVINYEVINHGTMETGEIFLDPAKCENGKPVTTDHYLKLITKLEIK